jgi:hypothetical protein
MTKQSARPNQQVGALKALLLTGSVIATLAGTRLLALQEPAETETSISAAESITVVVPAAESSSIPLPPTMRGAQIELKPIPQVVQPQINPVARTRSSQ